MNGRKFDKSIYVKNVPKTEEEPKVATSTAQGQWTEMKDFITKPKLGFYLFILCYVR
jgi:hypothetical protein